MVLPGLNKAVLERITKELGVQTLTDKLPLTLAQQIQPVIISNPKSNVIIEDTVLNDATSKTIFTTSTKKRTFIHGFQISVTKDAQNDSTYVRLVVTPKGLASKKLCYLRLEPTTAQQHIRESMWFNEKIELEKDTIIQISSETGTSSIDVGAVIYYSEEDVL